MTLDARSLTLRTVPQLPQLAAQANGLLFVTGFELLYQASRPQPRGLRLERCR